MAPIAIAIAAPVPNSRYLSGGVLLPQVPKAASQVLPDMFGTASPGLPVAFHGHRHSSAEHVPNPDILYLGSCCTHTGSTESVAVIP